MNRQEWGLSPGPSQSTLFNCALVEPAKSPKPRIPDAFFAGVGGSFGVFAYVVAFVITMALVPRVSEGSRQVVDLPWSVYVALPTVVALIPLIIIGLAVPRRNWNLAFLAVFNVAIAASTCVGWQLLRRDFIGKL
jgi:hypothetical protein